MIDRAGRIGVLGGTFDPIHIGHLVVADNALQQLQLDIVLFVPAGFPPHKRAHEISRQADRKAMIEIAIADRNEFRVSDIDLNREGPSFTFELLRRIDAEFTPSELFFIMGADSLRDFSSWSHPETILQIARLAVAGRPGVEISESVLRGVPGLQERLRMLDSPLSHVSSTALRLRLRRGQTIRYLIPQDVHNYIVHRKLYQGNGLNST
jgi:nicotinate-nucleotide adenylyltransferase